MLESLPVWVQIALQVLYVIFLFSLLFGLLVLGTFAFIIAIKSNVLKKEYLSTLDEHDKSVIMTYKSIESDWPFIKKNKKK